MVQKIHIRSAEPADAAAIAVLAGELGYPTTADEMAMRLRSASALPTDGVFIAEMNAVVGWVHVATVLSLESEPYAEIRGLVVAAHHRGDGIGTSLVRRAEEWAEAAGCRRIRVRTNVVREKTRVFYRKLGYAVTKTQEVFDKPLATGADSKGRARK